MTDNYEITKAIEEVKATLVSMENDGQNYASEYLSRESLAVCMNALDIIKNQQTEIERLKIENQSLRGAANSYKLHYNKARTEAVKELAEMLKETKFKHDNDYIIYAENVDVLVKKWQVIQNGKS